MSEGWTGKTMYYNISFPGQTVLRTPPAPETVELVSFDGGVSDRSSFLRPDRYWMIETDSASPRIARGGGYSYAAASFGAGSLVMAMTRFNRALAFDGESIEVEAGMNLGDLFAITGPKGLLLPVQPGYPGITIGGCIAADVHGKNPYADGTFSRLVESLALYHPRYGVMTADRHTNAEAFELTHGGYGLTGVILSAKLKLARVSGWVASVQRVEVGSPLEALDRLHELTDGAELAYTWHDAVPRVATFGRGFVYRGVLEEGGSFSSATLTHRRLDASSRRWLPHSLMGQTGAGFLTRGF